MNAVKEYATGMELQQKFDQLFKELDVMVERHDEIRAVLVALLSGENSLFVGDPGTGKTMLIESLSKVFEAFGINSMYYHLMNENSEKDELFGPLNIMKMREGKRVHETDGYLPSAAVACLDEIFKSSPAVLNMLLRMLNEGVFVNGNERVQCPLLAGFAASNEWPDSKKNLDALFDRFVIRKTVKPVVSAAGLKRLMWDSDADLTPDVTVRLSPQDVYEARRVIRDLIWQTDAVACIEEILKQVEAEGIKVGNRRRRKAVKVARANAYLNGSAEVRPQDLDILSAVLWAIPGEEEEVVGKIVTKLANSVEMRIGGWLEQAREIAKNANIVTLAEATAVGQKLQDIFLKLTEHSNESPRAEAAAKEVTHLISEVSYQTVGNDLS
tara:strand:+ start:1886 stop:3037 length:1152 start_codon:yes stop_codon:yes gene_type:complete